MRKFKPWSISTAVRNADRLRSFLVVLSQMGGEVWNKDAQESFQIRLIQARLYGAYSPQFYRNLPQSDIDLIESRERISYQQAADIFARKGYVDGPMRGRQSFKPRLRYM